MTSSKRFSMALAVLVLVVLTGASSAFAQVAFQMSSNERTARVEGIAEAVGTITLAATSGGTISADSTISLAFETADGTDTDIVGDVAGDPDPADPVDEFIADVACVVPTFAIDDNILILTFTTACTVVSGETIVIKGLRVNANAAGVGAIISATGTATVPAGEPPITFFIVNKVPVANVAEAFDISIQSGQNVLTCAETSVADTPEDEDPDTGKVVFIEIEENFNQAFTSAADEDGFADYGVGAEVGQTFTITFKDVPEDVNIELRDFDEDTLTTDLVSDDGGQDGDGGDLEFTFTITGTATTGDTEKVELTFAVTTSDPIDSVAGGITVDVGVSFEAGDLSDGEVPEFVANEVEDDAFDISDCFTRLLFPWVANIAGFDSGIAIANTTEDDVAFGASDTVGAQAQNGTCVLTGYPQGGGAPVSFTTPSVTAGGTQTLVLSGTTGFSGFAGYILGVCNFLNAHAFTFITDGFGSLGGPDVAEGYTANVVPAGSRTGSAGESLGH